MSEMSETDVIVVGDTRVRGRVLDDETRCAHYHSALDVIALRFACCGEWFPCHLCHEELADHASRPWPVSARATEAVICGVCASRLCIDAYIEVDACPSCGAEFNPGCRLHHALYFD